MEEYGEVQDFDTTYPLMKAWRTEMTSVAWNGIAFICKEIFSSNPETLKVDNSKKPIDDGDEDEDLSGYQIEKEQGKVIKHGLPFIRKVRVQ